MNEKKRNNQQKQFILIFVLFVLASGMFYKGQLRSHSIELGTPLRDVSSIAVMDVVTLDSIEKININTADTETLMLLPEIGEKTAEAILLYRQKNGAFQGIEEIQNVSGIGEKTFEKISDYIVVE